VISPALRRAAAGVVALGLALTLAACSTTSSGASGASETKAASSGAEAGAFPVTIKSALGSTTITKAPERVVAIGWGSADTLVSLGIVPVGIEKVTYGNDSHGDYPWVTAAIQKLGKKLPTTFDVYPDIDMTAVAQLNPDLIVAPQSGLTAAQYKTLSALAPTVAYPGAAWQTTWDDQISLIGQAVGQPKKAQSLITGIKTKLAAVKKANPDFSKHTFAYISMGNPGTLSVYLKGDPRVALLSAMGLKESPALAAVKPAAGSYLGTLGLEKSDLLDSTDVVVTWYYDKKNQQQVDSQPLIASIPAIKRGSVVSSTDEQFVMGSTFITPLSVPWAIDRYVPMIKKATEKVG
jgi:iron complex transport system substrate-binding protein